MHQNVFCCQGLNAGETVIRCFGPDIVWAGAEMRNAQQAPSSLQIGTVQDPKMVSHKHLDEFDLQPFDFFVFQSV